MYASVEQQSREMREMRAARLAPSVMDVVICMSRVFCSMD